MTLRITINSPEETSDYDAVVIDTNNHVTTVIKPGGSADFWVHGPYSLVIHERPAEKNEETEASPS